VRTRRKAPHRVVGIDTASDALAAAPRTATVDFQTGDVYAPAYPDGAFDVVHAHQVLQHLADPVAAPRGAEGSEWPCRDRTVTDASLISDLDNWLPTLSTRHWH
jgi:hypothetical protein